MPTEYSGHVPTDTARFVGLAVTKLGPLKMLDVLFRELAELRNDDRSAHSQYPAIIAAAVALIGAMAALYATTCPRSGPCPDPKMYVVPIWVYILAPTLPILLISYAVLVSSLGTLRSYYRRTIERRIHELTSQSAERLPIPSWGHIEIEVMGQTRAEPRLGLNWILIYGTITLLVLGGCIVLGSKIQEVRYFAFALILNGSLILVPITAAVLSIRGGARLWKSATTHLPRRLLRTDSRFRSRVGNNERSLISYLFLPRNQEELLKALFIPGGLLVGTTLAPGIPKWTWGVSNWDGLRSGFWHFLGFFFVFEFMIYQARYLFNDIRDRNIDSGKDLSKPRFPRRWVRMEKWRKNNLALKLAFGSFLGRLALALLIVLCVLPIENGMLLWHVGFLLTVFLFGSLYEYCRNRSRNSSGNSAWTVALTVVVGFSYGLRVVVGVWLAGVDAGYPLLLLALGASFLGSMIVALTWALESTRAEEKVLVKEKPHLVLYQNIVSRTVHRPWVAAFGSQKVLSGCQLWMAPWCISGVISIGLLAGFVFNLHRVDIGIGPLMLIAVGVAIALEPVAVAPAKITGGLTLFGFASAIMVFHHFSMSYGQSFVAAFVTTLPLGVMCVFRNMSFENLPNVMNKVVNFVGGLGRGIFCWFIKERNHETLVASDVNPFAGER